MWLRVREQDKGNYAKGIEQCFSAVLLIWTLAFSYITCGCYYINCTCVIVITEPLKMPQNATKMA